MGLLAIYNDVDGTTFVSDVVREDHGFESKTVPMLFTQREIGVYAICWVGHESRRCPKSVRVLGKEAIESTKEKE
ncbi:uncharacterized protein G2W53_034027 [Senna tora]|uniref:Uncharacterized protein n=1 Tax=Senna tora TaxID=362788 RepID=A0A834WBI4_9FABA|nr:uncharacterized protein G2W53_034027 [Senna tora]